MRDNGGEKYQLKKAEEFGCYGLINGYAKDVKTNQCHYAHRASKADGPFYCPNCYSDVILRKCSNKIDHFAHKAPLSPVLPKGESVLHQKCKDNICNHLSTLFPEGKWETERPIKENKQKQLTALRPDISGRINGIPLAIEIQASSLTIPEVIKRTISYSRRKIAILWLVPLSEKLESSPFRPRLYERYFHSIYYGRTYYWWPELDNIIRPIHYGVATRHIEYSTFYQNGEHVEVGGFDKAYKVIKNPIFGSSLTIHEGFSLHQRGKFIPENEKKMIPACLTWQDSLEKWWV